MNLFGYFLVFAGFIFHPHTQLQIFAGFTFYPHTQLQIFAGFTFYLNRASPYIPIFK